MGQFVLIGLVAVLGVRDRGRGRLGRGPRALAVLAGLASMSAGLVVAARGARDLGANLTPMPHPRADAQLVETGIYAQIRHPLYAAVILVTLGWATAMASARSFTAAAVLVAWLDAKARREEAWLDGQFPRYAEYTTRTPRFVPGIY